MEAQLSVDPGIVKGGGGSDTFTKRQFTSAVQAYDRSVRTEIASRAFNVLWQNADQLGLAAYCGLPPCRGRWCQAPHYLDVLGFLRLDEDVLLAAHGNGETLVLLQLVVQAYYLDAEG